MTILAGPTFAEATKAPLAGVLKLTTDVETRVSVAVEDGEGGWGQSFYDFGTTHQVTLLGFKPGRTNLITVTVYDKHRNEASSAQPLVFATDPLPSDFPSLTLLQSLPQKMEPGYTLFRVAIDGNFRATPFDPPVPDWNNYSRAVEYDINKTTMEVSQVWDYGSSAAAASIFG